jgi:hypothetical protein
MGIVMEDEGWAYPAGWGLGEHKGGRQPGGDHVVHDAHLEP